MVGDTYDINQQGQIKYPKPIEPMGAPTPTNPVNPMVQPQTTQVQQMASNKDFNDTWRLHFGPLPKYTPTTLNAQQERRYQAWVNKNPWFAGMPQEVRQIALQGGGDYDYRGAWLAGVRPGKTGHWLSINPKTGAPLKNPETHPTWWKEEFMSKYGRPAGRAGFNIDAPGMTREQAWQFITNQGAR